MNRKPLSIILFSLISLLVPSYAGVISGANVHGVVQFDGRNYWDAADVGPGALAGPDAVIDATLPLEPREFIYSDAFVQITADFDGSNDTLTIDAVGFVNGNTPAFNYDFDFVFLGGNTLQNVTLLSDTFTGGVNYSFNATSLHMDHGVFAFPANQHYTAVFSLDVGQASSPVPEPSSYAMLLLGLLGLVGLRRKVRKK